MDNNKLKILQINACDIGGGAAKVAWDLLDGYKKQGHSSWMAVNRKFSKHNDVVVIPNDRPYNNWEKLLYGCSDICDPFVGKVKGFGRLKKILDLLGCPKNLLSRALGREEFYYPGSHEILKVIPEVPNIIHCHNLHRRYFDLHLLKLFSNNLPTIITLHDAWLLSGHCAHSFDCERWKTGCGDCPNLNIYPSIRRDASHYNWGKKLEIYSQSKLYISTPCNWLMDKVKQSILFKGVVDYKVIHNGINLDIFKPEDKIKVREILDLPKNSKILLFVGQGGKNNSWKDFSTLENVVKRLPSIFPEDNFLLICLGGNENIKSEFFNNLEIRFLNYQTDSKVVAKYYQASDLYIHSTKIDTFPNSILEALACGTPVIASNIGGISEQIKQINYFDNGYDLNTATGVLFSMGSEDQLLEGIKLLLKNRKIYLKLSENALKDVSLRFDLKDQINNYLNWFEEIVSTWK